MRRNDDLIRELLLLSANAPGAADAYTLYPEYSKDDILFNVQMLQDAGLAIVKITDAQGKQSVTCSIERLTHAGCDYLATIEDTQLWTHIKKQIAQSAQAVPLNVLIDVAYRAFRDYTNL